MKDLIGFFDSQGYVETPENNGWVKMICHYYVYTVCCFKSGANDSQVRLLLPEIRQLVAKMGSILSSA